MGGFALGIAAGLTLQLLTSGQEESSAYPPVPQISICLTLSGNQANGAFASCSGILVTEILAKGKGKQLNFKIYFDIFMLLRILNHYCHRLLS